MSQFVSRDPRGRPAKIDYAPDERCQLCVEIPAPLKRAIYEKAELSDRPLRDEVRLALSAWTTEEPVPA